MASGSKKVVYAAIFGNLAIAVSKFIAAYITGSSAMIAEGIHSVVDTGNGGLMLLGMKRSSRAPDTTHPFGYGKELYFWALLVAIIIFAVGGGMSVYEGILHVLHPATIENPTVNFWVLGVAMLFETGSLYVAVTEVNKAKGSMSLMRYIRTSKDPSMFTILLEDAAAMAGLVVAFVGVLLGHLLHNPYFDGAASIVIGLLLMGVAYFLTIETKGLLVGESADPVHVQKMRDAVLRDPAVESVGPLLTMHLGPNEVLVNIEVSFKPDLPVSELDDAFDRVEQVIRGVDPSVRQVFLEASSLRGISAG